MMRYRVFDYNGAMKFLEDKGLLREIEAVLESVKSVGHKDIQEEFCKRGWECEKRIFHEVAWA